MTRRSPGEGSILQRSDGRWMASLQVDGRRRTVYGKSRAAVYAKLAELRKQADAAGVMPLPGKRTVGELLDAWLDAQSPGWKPPGLSRLSRASSASGARWWSRTPRRPRGDGW